MAKKYLTDINLGKNELQNAVLQPLASAPSSPTEGQMYYNTADDTPYIYANGGWLDMGVQGGSGATDISIGQTGTTVTVNSNTGADGTIPAADGTNAGVFTAASYTKLSGIETNADVTDAVNVGSSIYGATAKTTPTGSDEFAIIDSAASNVLKKITYTSLANSITALVVDAAPGTLDTLNELAAALGDDPAFATTITTSIGTKAAKSANLSDLASAATAFTNIKQAATTTATGVVELATQGEAQAKTDTTRALTAASVSDFARKYTATIGDGTSTSIAVTHGLGSQYVTAQIYEASGGQQVECEVTLTSSTQVTFGFNIAPTSAQYRVVIIG